MLEGGAVGEVGKGVVVGKGLWKGLMEEVVARVVLVEVVAVPLSRGSRTSST